MNQIKLILIYFKKKLDPNNIRHNFFFDNPGCPGQLTRTTTNHRAH
jgi:hypothetical protein